MKRLSSAYVIAGPGRFRWCFRCSAWRCSLMDSLPERTLWSSTLTVGEEEEPSPELTLPSSLFGGVRIEARATLPTNRWAAFQVSVVAADGTVLLELVKEAWAENASRGRGVRDLERE